MKNSEIHTLQKTKDGGVSSPRLTKRDISNSLSPKQALEVNSWIALFHHKRTTFQACINMIGGVTEGKSKRGYFYDLLFAQIVK